MNTVEVGDRLRNVCCVQAVIILGLIIFILFQYKKMLRYGHKNIISFSTIVMIALSYLLGIVYDILTLRELQHGPLTWRSPLFIFQYFIGMFGLGCIAISTWLYNVEKKSGGDPEKTIRDLK